MAPPLIDQAYVAPLMAVTAALLPLLFGQTAAGALIAGAGLAVTATGALAALQPLAVTVTL
jgi:hypothetical protein